MPSCWNDFEHAVFDCGPLFVVPICICTTKMWGLRSLVEFLNADLRYNLLLVWVDAKSGEHAGLQIFLSPVTAGDDCLADIPANVLHSSILPTALNSRSTVSGRRNKGLDRRTSRCVIYANTLYYTSEPKSGDFVNASTNK